MSVNAPSLPTADVKDEAEDLSGGQADLAERRALVALVLLAAVLALGLLLIARRRRTEAQATEDDD